MNSKHNFKKCANTQMKITKGNVWLNWKAFKRLLINLLIFIFWIFTLSPANCIYVDMNLFCMYFYWRIKLTLIISAGLTLFMCTCTCIYCITYVFLFLFVCLNKWDLLSFKLNISVIFLNILIFFVWKWNKWKKPFEQLDVKITFVAFYFAARGEMKHCFWLNRKASFFSIWGLF